MSAQPVVLAAASYPSRATAEQDFWAVGALKRHGPVDQVAAAIVGRFWHEVPRDRLRTMANLLEAGQTGLIVVAVDHRAEHVTPVLSNAATTIVTDCIPADLQADFATAIALADHDIPLHR
jgi:hypothetical protein